MMKHSEMVAKHKREIEEYHARREKHRARLEDIEFEWLETNYMRLTPDQKERHHSLYVKRTTAALSVFISENCRVAESSDYQRFLDARTKPCTRYHDRDFPTDEYYVALNDCKVPAACGALAIRVIAPAGIKVEHEGLHTSHCDIFSVDDADSARVAPSYNDANMD